MEIEKIFRNLILFDFLILILIVISSIYKSDNFTEAYLYLDKGLLHNYGSLLRIFSLFLFFLYLLTLNLLYRFISYGKNLYLFLIISGLLLNFINGPVIYSSFEGVLDQLGGIISGAILIILYYSPIKEYFKK